MDTLLWTLILVHACMKAHLVFCPVYPPREGADSARLLASARDCGAKHGLTSASALRTMRVASLVSSGMTDVLRAIHWYACPHGSNVMRFNPTPSPPMTDPHASDLAMLQYTSVSWSERFALLCSCVFCAHVRVFTTREFPVYRHHRQ